MSEGSVFAVAANGSSIQEASGPSELLSISKPFTKLDVTNIASFQTIQLLFNHEPPQPPAGSPYYTNTLVYSFPHGYDYIPSIWMEWQNNSPTIPPTPPPGSSATTYFAFGDDSAGYAAYDQIVNGNTEANPPCAVAVVNYNDGSGSGAGGFTQALLYATVDDVNFNLYIMKQTLGTVSGSVLPLYLNGTILNVRTYVFTEPATTSTY